MILAPPARPFETLRCGSALPTLIGLVACVLAALPSPARAQSSTARVKVSTLVEVPAPEGPLYRVTYQYEFPERDTVFIDGIGTMPAHGELTYLLSAKSVRFLDAFGGRLLHTEPLEDPVRLMGGDTADLPREADFPEAYRQGRWAGTRLFADVVISVLDQYFPRGYRAYRRSDRQNFLTMFATLPPVSDRVTAAVAVLVSAPADANPNDVVFTLQFQGRERRSHTEWRNELGGDTEAAVQKFIREVLAALQRGPK
jgi:hypothetical protein